MQCRSVFFCLMIRRPPSSTRTDTLFPYPPLFRSGQHAKICALVGANTLDQPVQLPPAYGVFAAFHRARRAIIQVIKFMRSEEHTSELQSLMRISYAVFCLKKKK